MNSIDNYKSRLVKRVININFLSISTFNMNCKAFRYKKLSSCLGRWFLLLLCLNPLLLPAQNYPTRHFTMRDGLPSMAIRCIYKDTRGLVWMGTDAGLCSFDGQSFRIYKAAEGMTASQIRALAEDEEGNIWIGSLGEGLYKYDGQHFERFTKKNGMADDRVRVLCYSKLPLPNCRWLWRNNHDKGGGI